MGSIFSKIHDDPTTREVLTYGCAFTMVGLFAEGLPGMLIGSGLGCLVGLLISVINYNNTDHKKEK